MNMNIGKFRKSNLIKIIKKFKKSKTMEIECRFINNEGNNNFINNDSIKDVINYLTFSKKNNGLELNE